jgi:hypothetical protein
MLARSHTTLQVRRRNGALNVKGLSNKTLIGKAYCSKASREGCDGSFRLARLETRRREQEESSMTECSFAPKLVAHVPWPVTKKKPPPGLEAPQSAGQRMYAEGLDARRQWQLHLQKLRQVGWWEEDFPVGAT